MKLFFKGLHLLRELLQAIWLWEPWQSLLLPPGQHILTQNQHALVSCVLGDQFTAIDHPRNGSLMNAHQRCRFLSGEIDVCFMTLLFVGHRFLCSLCPSVYLHHDVQGRGSLFQSLGCYDGNAMSEPIPCLYTLTGSVAGKAGDSC